MSQKRRRKDAYYMITKGSKIELVKPMGVFDNIGEVCEVTNVAEDGVISFKFGGCHLGCMSYSEYEKYFKLYEPPKKREWTEWSSLCMSYYDLFNRLRSQDIRVRDNGKTTQIKTQWQSANEICIKAESNCSPMDTYNFCKGIEIAKSRLRIKLLQAQLVDYLNKM